MYLKNNYLLNGINISLNDDYIYMLLLKYGRVDKEYSEQEIADLCDYKKEEVEELLEFFNNETENGKLYISYPMVEAIKHLKDNVDFKNTIEESKKIYKSIVAQNCNNNLQHLDKLTFDDWSFIINENSKKANFIVNNAFTFPTKIIEQLEIFDNQKTKYLDVANKVSVLSAFPIFLLDYYGVDKFKLTNRKKKIES